MSPSYRTDFPINQIGLILTRIQTYLHWLSLKLSKTWSTLIIFNLSTLHAALGWRLYTPSHSPFLSMCFIIPACFVEFWWHFALKHQNSLKIFWNRNGCQWCVWNICGGLILNWLIRIFGWNYLHISKILDVIWRWHFHKVAPVKIIVEWFHFSLLLMLSKLTFWSAKCRSATLRIWWHHQSLSFAGGTAGIKISFSILTEIYWENIDCGILREKLQENWIETRNLNRVTITTNLFARSITSNKHNSYEICLRAVSLHTITRSRRESYC